MGCPRRPRRATTSAPFTEMSENDISGPKGEKKEKRRREGKEWSGRAWKSFLAMQENPFTYKIMLSELYIGVKWRSKACNTESIYLSMTAMITAMSKHFYTVLQNFDLTYFLSVCTSLTHSLPSCWSRIILKELRLILYTL